MRRYIKFIPSMLSCFLLSAAMVTAVNAQGGGQKPLTLLVPTSSSTAADITSRIIQPLLQQRLDMPVIVENRTGASGAIGMAAVVRAAPDGHTVLVGPSTMAMINLLQQELTWNPVNDFEAVAQLANLSYAIVVNPDLPVNNVQELIALAKSKPGELNFATPGVGTPHHLVTEMFKQVTGINVLHVPYKTSAGAVNDLAGGQVDFAFQAVHSIMPLVEAGKLRIIATVTDARTPWTDNVPTLKEQGVQGVVINSWIGAFVPKNTPQEIIDRYNREIGAILEMPDIKQKLFENGIVVHHGTSGDMAALLKNDTALWKRVASDGRVALGPVQKAEKDN